MGVFARRSCLMESASCVLWQAWTTAHKRRFSLFCSQSYRCAASQVKSTTGGGVIFGMTCGKIAAETAYEALLRNEFSSYSLQTYQKRCEEELGAEIRFMLKIRNMLNTLPDHKLDDIINFCTKIGLERTLQNLRDVDFQRGILLRTLWNPRMFLAIFYFLLSYFHAKH